MTLAATYGKPVEGRSSGGRRFWSRPFRVGRLVWSLSFATIACSSTHDGSTRGASGKISQAADCGFTTEPAPRGAPLLDPCAQGTSVGDVTIERTAGPPNASDLKFTADADHSYCVRGTRTGSPTATVTLDGNTLFGHGEWQPTRPTAEARPVVSAGDHDLRVSMAGKPGSSVTIAVLAAASTSTPKQEGQGTAGLLTLSNLDESPDVFRRSGPAATIQLSVNASVSQLAGFPSDQFQFVLRYHFDVFPTGTCSPARTLSGEAPTAGGTQPLTAAWNGNADSGAPLPDGEYLFRARVDLVKKGPGSQESVLDSVSTAAQTFRLTGVTDPAACQAAVEQAALQNHPPGSDPLTLNVQVDMAFCRVPDLTYCQAQVLAQANFDRRMAAMKYVATTISSAQYLALTRDRSRKFHNLVKNPDLLDAVCAGDNDGDLVPNESDKCPDTPPLVPTTSDGCTDNTLPPAPNRVLIDALLATMGVIHDPNCAGSPGPTTPRPVALCRASSGAAGYTLWFSPVTNVNSSCTLWYEINAQLIRADGSRFNEFLAPKSTEIQPSPAPAVPYVFLQLLPTDPGGRGQWGQATLTGATVSMRAVDGNGDSSTWSPPIRLMRDLQADSLCADLGIVQ